ncbi:unnamed protein product [Peniophora sp. CBMAI 1063]|nr:unnamed protein product [Peniophora sp. CBMAI 1063]
MANKQQSPGDTGSGTGEVPGVGDTGAGTSSVASQGVAKTVQDAGSTSAPSQDSDSSSVTSQDTVKPTKDAPPLAKSSNTPVPQTPAAAPSTSPRSGVATPTPPGGPGPGLSSPPSRPVAVIDDFPSNPLSSVSLSFKGIRVNFNIEFAQIALRIFAWLRQIFTKSADAPGETPEAQTTTHTSHIPRRVGFMLAGLLLATVIVNWSFSASTSPCHWKAHTDALSDLQMSRIGVLLNSTALSNSRVTELAAARIGISELRTYVQDRHVEAAAAAALDGTLKQYGDDLFLALYKLLRVDASIAALAHITVAHNTATYEYLDLSAYSPWWYSLFCWGACQGPSFESSYMGMLNLEDVMLRALEATLYDAAALRDSVQRLYDDSSRLHHHATATTLIRSPSASDVHLDTLAQLWDTVVPYRTPTAMKANRRRLLSGARPALRRAMDHALVTQADVLNLMEQLRLLKMGLKARSADTSWLWGWIWPSRPNSDNDLCSPRNEQGIRAFKSLLLAANELRSALTRQT